MRRSRVAGVFVAVVLAASSLAPRAEAAGEAIHVSPVGSDHAAGTATAPLRTLEKARDQARARGVRTVVLHGGRYELSESFRLTSADSGSAGAPMVYRAAPGKPVVVTGSRSVPMAAVSKVTDPALADRLDPAVRERVRQVDLAALGIRDAGKLHPEVTGADKPALVQVVQGEVMTHEASYPDRGHDVKIASVVSEGDRPTWRIEDRRPFAWKSTEGVWIRGFPGFNWAYQQMPLAKLDPAASTLTAGNAAEFGSKPGQGFSFVNVLEGLSQPDEAYAVDDKLLFVETGGPVWVTTLTDPLVVGEGASHIRFEGIQFKASRGDGVRFAGGSNIEIRNSLFTNLGLRAIQLTDVRDSIIDRVSITRVGRGGIDIDGGDRRTLAPGRNVVSNSRIEHFSERYPRYSPAVSVSGVGNRVERNEMAHAAHVALQLRGNDHQIVANHIHDVVQSSSDSGALYGGRDWTERGNVIADNVFARIGQGSHDNIAVYLDDMMSGTRVERNLLVDVPVGVQHSGRDNQVVNNVFVRTKRAVYIGNWGGGSSAQLNQNLTKVPYQSEAYAKYDHLAGILADEPTVPKYNTLTGNRLVGSGAFDLAQIRPDSLTQQDNQTVDKQAITTGKKLSEYRIPKDSPLRRRPGPDLARVGPP